MPSLPVLNYCIVCYVPAPVVLHPERASFHLWVQLLQIYTKFRDRPFCIIVVKEATGKKTKHTSFDQRKLTVVLIQKKGAL